MPSARNPDASLASSTVGSSAPSSAGAATPPLAAGKAVRRTDSPPAPAPAGAPAPALAFGGLRLVEVPGGWPPYDCEVHGTACPAACEVSVVSPCADLDPGAPGGAEPPGPSLTFSAARPAEGTADTAVAWSRQFAQVVAEILAGARSPRQIAPWTTERVRDRIILLTQTLSTGQDRKSTRLNSSHPSISYAVFCLKKKKKKTNNQKKKTKKKSNKKNIYIQLIKNTQMNRQKHNSKQNRNQ